MKLVQSRKDRVTTVHDLVGPRPYRHLGQDQDIVKFAVSDLDHTGDVAVQVQKGVSVIASLRFRNLANQNSARQRSITVESNA